MSDKTKLIAKLGFSAIFGLILVLSYFMLSHLSDFRDNMTTVVENNNTKSELASTMRDAIRMRAISLRNMLFMKDIFDRDEEMLRFNAYAARFATSREELLKLPKTATEEKIYNDLFQAIRLAQPLNLQASEYLLSESHDYDTTRLIVEEAFNGQEKVLLILDELVEFQRISSEQALLIVNDQYEDTKQQLLVSILFVGFITFFILFSLSRFITQKNQELQIANETKSMFLANMSHEIRTPLTAIIGFSKLLLGKRLSEEEQNSKLSTVLKNAEHLLNIINDILDISKIEANRLELDLNTFSLCEFMFDVKNMVEGPIKQKGLEFVINYKFPLPELVTSDEVRLKQILVNLCSNATKFTEQGHVIIDLHYDRIDKILHFSVTDSGIGLTQNQTRKIFDAFQQAESSTTRKFGGTGLGLSICRQLVCKLGGELVVESQVNEGSCFKFSINLSDSKNTSLCYSKMEFKQIEKNHADDQDDIRVKGHVLLVDDTVDNQVLVSTYLKDAGAEVIVADNGKIAVELAGKNNFDLILMDMQMPVMGGIEAVEIIRKQNSTVPIAMLTANAFKEERDQCYAAGCNDFLTKPIDVSALYKVVSECLPAVDKLEYTNDSVSVQRIENETNSRQVSDVFDDENVIISSLMGSSENIDKMVGNFILQLPTYLNDIENAYNSKDLEKLSYTTHQLKGVGGNYGFLMITNTCTKIEEEIKSKQNANIEYLLDELKNIVINIENGLKYHGRTKKLA